MLEKYHSRIEAALRRAAEQMGEPSRLRDACAYALQTPGKRLRPTLVLMVADALGHGLDALPAALSVEYFHTASLIADDLPCMDDDDERRGQPSLHCVVEESVALLASYTLIAAGYEGIYKNGAVMQENALFRHRADEATVRALEIATRCAGIRGATGGQFLDLFPPDQSVATLRRTISQKTATLFQISMVFGWLFGGGASSKLQDVEAAAHHLGMAFQIRDDLHDTDETNIATLLGRKDALALFGQEMNGFEEKMRSLQIWTSAFQEVAAKLRLPLLREAALF